MSEGIVELTDATVIAIPHVASVARESDIGDMWLVNLASGQTIEVFEREDFEVLVRSLKSYASSNSLQYSPV